jgi:hypothetical protein
MTGGGLRDDAYQLSGKRVSRRGAKKRKGRIEKRNHYAFTFAPLRETFWVKPLMLTNIIFFFRFRHRTPSPFGSTS